MNLLCYYCNSSDIVKNGILKNGGQRYRCRFCNKTFTLGGKRGTYISSYKEKIALEYCHNKISARNLVKKYNISTSTLIRWSKNHKNNCNICN